MLDLIVHARAGVCARVCGLIAIAPSHSWICPADACERGEALPFASTAKVYKTRGDAHSGESTEADVVIETDFWGQGDDSASCKQKRQRLTLILSQYFQCFWAHASRELIGEGRVRGTPSAHYFTRTVQSDHPLPGFRRYGALPWWTSSGDRVKKTNHPGRQQVHCTVRKWAVFTSWRGGLCCNTGGSWQGYTLQMLCRDIFWILPSAPRQPRARPTQRESPAMRPHFLRPVLGRTWRCRPLLRATGPREFTPMDGTGSTAVQGSGVAAVIIPPREVRELETHLAASWRLVDWNT